ncbi:conserved hypothetical protein [Theileria orientalis strain Shintoku]|uniref:Uncharacterized protein n=1 Tax=Theileria orientalis strain Shintoku TaxID=869250 RepID=J4D8L4_THEOR|nr:conserved hypothetical protein [Theileria orientalis strain Shintoku]BAM40840.1 conserved hypothetical protein [Theileria orientalis strain Shintoku]|eukprot:XP_009691141.1 conserved hypothetical protein [Theileria orientalis strain Shintoku]
MTSDNIYTVITGSKPLNSGKHSEISEYLRELLYKDYDAIASTSKTLLEDDKKLRDNLHKFVIDSAPIALKNINCCTNTSELVTNLSKTALDISKATNSCSLKAKECASSLSDVVQQLWKVNSDYDYYKFVNSLVTFLNEFEFTRDERKLSRLLAFNEVLKGSEGALASKLGSFLGDRVCLTCLLGTQVKKILCSKELELFNSFNNDPEQTAKTVSLIEKIGFSTREQIAVGFIKNRLKCMKDCFQASLESARTEPKRSVFGDVDTHLSTLANRTYQDFFDTIAHILRETEPHELKKINLDEFDSQILELLGWLAPLGLSFFTLTNFTFSSFLRDVFSS